MIALLIATALATAQPSPCPQPPPSVIDGWLKPAPQPPQPYKPWDQMVGDQLAKLRALVAAGGAHCLTPAEKSAVLEDAISMDEPALVAEALKLKPDLSAWTGDQYNPPLAWALRVDMPSCAGGPPGNKPEVIRLLIAAGADPNQHDLSGRTPLFDAQTAQAVRALLAGGADLEARDADGNTPLLRPRTDEAAVAMIAAGADITARNKAQEGVADVARERGMYGTLAALRAPGVTVGAPDRPQDCTSYGS
ncbi:MAG: Pfs, and Ankyrin domain protein [Caulobacter sp.]|nr:Pfs, and Ankyrin domain protein [Caulobacter sp.]